jgi:hypothetical protein
MMRAVRKAPAVLVACVLAFVALEAAAMALYPGGTWWDPTTRGPRFWHNFLCDLAWNPALDGLPNPVGSRLAQAAMLVLVAGFVPFWWIAPSLFPGRRKLGSAVRLLGLASVAGMAAVALLPSNRFGSVHGAAVVVAGVPGLSAALLATAGMLRAGARGSRACGAVGGAMLVFALGDFALYVETMLRGGPGPTLLPVAQKVAVLLLLGWMVSVASRLCFGAPPPKRRANRGRDPQGETGP